ncbi:hypothetical protein CL656_07220 [bacterium]|nr:hypothetical protein [bacterium]|tara:strand:- start:1354 stop:1623 length:270 start_codon:yes stop_codon:yes gene_type:complete
MTQEIISINCFYYNKLKQFIPDDCINNIDEFIGIDDTIIQQFNLCKIFIKYSNRSTLKGFGKCKNDCCTKKCYTEYCQKCNYETDYSSL